MIPQYCTAHINRVTGEKARTTPFKRYDGLKFLNEHGDLYFILHNSSVKIILFKLKKLERKKKASKGRKDVAKCVVKARYSRIKIMTSEATSRGTF